ncbi:MAG: nuclear transport factor 2 family protein [Deltaproteobacteria bacterium]|jgi:3-phenylpropionate/cinnamic acid dioxygenase small subunit|nr:nuclear transport factor 2 family protein [Deltaproteobacteria bacterium]MBW2497176.1 nuclear transport factor 2 family protein [Deltaproteobacteria bacterium]
MSLTLDHQEIMATLARYSTALDQRDWALLDQVFTEDLVYDAGEWITRSRSEYLDRLRPYLEGCGPTQHLLGNYRIEIDGDEARSAVYVRAFHVGTRELSETTYEMFGEYRDELVRSNEGWRSRHRSLRLLLEQGSRAVLRPAS